MVLEVHHSIVSANKTTTSQAELKKHGKVHEELRVKAEKAEVDVAAFIAKCEAELAELRSA